MRVLRKGARGKDVSDWQNFLRGENFYKSVVDGDFGNGTHDATKKFQRKHGLTADGVVGNQTFGVAFTLGFSPLKDDDNSKYGTNWPPKPSFSAMSKNRRVQVFGEIQFKPSGSSRNPEGITITNDWAKYNLTKVHIPQLKGVIGAPKSGKVFWHKKGVEQLQGLFQAWEDEGLSHLVLGWAGSWVPRFIRGSRSVLSNHSWATAFDINVPWNGLGRQPALVGKKGSVRELVPIANEFGYWWGGYWGRNYGGSGRPDGMHFELAKIL